jgi:hypothetical protein
MWKICWYFTTTLKCPFVQYRIHFINNSQSKIITTIESYNLTFEDMTLLGGEWEILLVLDNAINDEVTVKVSLSQNIMVYRWCVSKASHIVDLWTGQRRGSASLFATSILKKDYLVLSVQEQAGMLAEGGGGILSFIKKILVNFALTIIRYKKWNSWCKNIAHISSCICLTICVHIHTCILCSLSLQTNYTDCVTAACRRS